MSPNRLLRLYPGLWRLRYGAEFLALLESAPITRTVVRDVVRSAAHEWVFRTRVGRLLIGLTIGTASALCGLALAQVASPPSLQFRTWIDSGWAIALAIIVFSIPMMVGTLLVIAAGPQFARIRLRTQLLALFLASTLVEWLQIVSVGSAVDFDRLVGACLQGAFYVTFWLTLMYNVERNRDMSTRWSGPWTPSADRY